MESLADQALPPTEVIVADGGSSRALVERVHEGIASLGLPGRVEVLPGSVVRTRNLALPMVAGDVLAFLDSDEVAPRGWLAALTEPMVRGEADFTGGPTRPLGEPHNRWEAYLNAFDEWFYREVVAKDITALPMGNSAWGTQVLRAVGGFDERFHYGGEDYDIALRAVASGHRGLFVPGAWVYHDQSHLNTIGKLLRRKYRYSVGAAMAYRKNRVLRAKAIPAVATARGFRHPLEYLSLLLKPIALVHGTLEWALRRD